MSDSTVDQPVPKNIHDLEQRLADEGCSTNNYAVGSSGAASDAYCLTRVDGRWRVFYTERGLDNAPMFESLSEEDACAYFFRYIMSMRHDHLVGFFQSQQDAQELSAKLEQHGIGSHQDRIPYGGWEDPRFRVFVVGKAIFKTKELLGEVPIED